MAAEASPAFSSFGCNADASLVVWSSAAGSAAGAAMAAVCAGSSIVVSVLPGTMITAISWTSAMIASTERIAGSAVSAAGSAAASSTAGSKASATVVSVAAPSAATEMS